LEDVEGTRLKAYFVAQGAFFASDIADKTRERRFQNDRLNLFLKATYLAQSGRSYI
jgi:hypothetical protein